MCRRSDVLRFVSEGANAVAGRLLCKASKIILRIAMPACWGGLLGPRGTLRVMRAAAFLDRYLIRLLRHEMVKRRARRER